MKTKLHLLLALTLVFTFLSAASAKAQQGRPQGPCDIYAAAGDPCVAAHSTTRALYAAYNGPLYQVLRQSDGKTLDIGVAKSSAADPGGYANAAAQDAFCANTVCWITTIYDQSPKHNHLNQAPRGNFSGPALGGANNLPIADMAPISVMGHKVYGAFIAPGMGLRQNDAKGTAVDDQAEGQYWVINGHHFNSGCCFDYGNAEIDSRDDNNGTMETTYFGDTTPWYHGNPPGPWVMTDQENNLVGCVNPDGSKLCATLPNITWRFVTAMAKGEPHHWTSMGGDSQQGQLQVMFDGPRIDLSYDPMRKQGAILLGNGGDNSVGSQGTFYEGAMTASGTFPSDATDQLIQANVVAARYAEQPISIASAATTTMPTGLQTFAPGGSQDTTVTFTNTTSAPATGLTLHVALPNQWTADNTSKTFPDSIAPGASVTATFKITSGPAAFNGDLIATAAFTSNGTKRSETAAEKLRNVSPIKINEFRVGTASPANTTNSFIEFYNAGSSPVDISNWTLTQHQTVQAISSSIKIPAGKKLAPKSFYLLGLSASGLAVPVRAGDKTIHLRSTTGMTAGDTIIVDGETHKVASLGTAASVQTTLWQPLPDGPILNIPVGSTNIPVANVTGFTVGEKISLGYGDTYPAVARNTEKYEVVTVTAVGKPGTQAFVATDAKAGATNIQVTNVSNITAGDKIRLDIDSVGHGIETVTVTRVGTGANRTLFVAPATAGATNIKVRSITGFANGDKVLLGTPANQKTYTITSVGTPGATGTGITFTPAFPEAHSSGEDVILPGTGLDIAAPLKFNHAANLPFSARGTGITFTPATTFPHMSNQPVQPLGTGITLDSPLTKAHPIDAVITNTTIITTAGYQGTPQPDQWFGGPALSPMAGNMVLRDASGHVVDSLNYGLLVDPWASEGYQAVSGTSHSGCRVIPPGTAGGTGTSAGRFPDGTDTDSNCTDFLTESATSLSAATAIGATNIKVASVAGFTPGQPLQIDTGTNQEAATIATIGSAGATTLVSHNEAAATTISVEAVTGFTVGQTIAVGNETATVASINRAGNTISLSNPLTNTNPAGTKVSGTGITLTTALKQPHNSAASVAGNAATPGAPNRYYR